MVKLQRGPAGLAQRTGCAGPRAAGRIHCTTGGGRRRSRSAARACAADRPRRRRRLRHQGLHRSPATTRWATPRPPACWRLSSAPMPPSPRCSRPRRRWKPRCAPSGYGLHRVALPPQEVGATVRLEVVTLHHRQGHHRGPQHLRRGQRPPRVARTARRRRRPTSSGWRSRPPSPTRTRTSRCRSASAKADEPDQHRRHHHGEGAAPLDLRASAHPTRARSRPAATGSPSAGGHTNLFDRDHQFIGAYTTSLERHRRRQAAGPGLQGAAVRAGRRARRELHPLGRGGRLRRVHQHGRRPHGGRDLHPLPGARRRPPQLRGRGAGRQGVQRRRASTTSSCRARSTAAAGRSRWATTPAPRPTPPCGATTSTSPSTRGSGAQQRPGVLPQRGPAHRHRRAGRRCAAAASYPAPFGQGWLLSMRGAAASTARTC